MLDFLSENPLFKGVNKKDLRFLTDKIGRRIIPRGDYLVYQGETEQYFYIIVQGKLIAYKEDEEKKRLYFGELSRHDVIGEIPLLAGYKWHISLYAQKDTEIIILSKKTLFNFLQTQPVVIKNIIQSMADKFSHFTENHYSGTKVKTIAIGSISSINTDKFINLYVETLKTNGKALFIKNEINSNNNYSSDQEIKNDLIKWEKEYDWIIIKVDFDDRLWTKTIIKNIDRLLLIADCDQQPIDNIFVKNVFKKKGDSSFIEMIFLNISSQPKTCNTEKWINSYPVKMHYHVHQKNISDIKRTARISIEKSVGVVLGSGGARTFAHIGVLQALKENNIPVDRICGTGLSAFIAALFAYGYSIGEIKNINRKITKKLSSYLDYTFPVISLIRGKKLKKLFDHFFGDKKIEDLPIPFFCVSSPLDSLKPFVHTKGNLSTAVLASLSVPGILPPVFLSDKFLIDGSFSNILPIDIMLDISQSGPIIAIDVETSSEPKFDSPFPPVVSGFKELIKQFFFKKYKMPNIFDTLLSSAYIHSLHQKELLYKKELADILITPELKEIRTLDFSMIDKIIEKGYSHTIEHLDEYKKQLHL
jgi:NTE family protein